MLAAAPVSTAVLDSSVRLVLTSFLLVCVMQAHVEAEASGQAPKGSAPRRTNNGACNCKKSRCLKMYCECFRDDRDCGPNCNCKGCANNVYHEEERQEAKRRIVDRKPAIARRTNNNHNHRAPSPTRTDPIVQPPPAAIPIDRPVLRVSPSSRFPARVHEASS